MLCKESVCTAVCPLFAAVGAVLFAYWLSLAPTPVPASAPPDAFSAERAFRHIETVCVAPQPAGSLNNDRACRYIEEELARLGVESELLLRYARTGDRAVSRQRAVLGRIRGRDSTRAFAIDAHFDSVPWGPGAADDFSGIAAMLETARAIKAGPPLKNDVIFVFSDEEEFNMGGAKAFREHPWFADVGVMLGLETRGNSGPALMFETSPRNGFVVREMARSDAGARTNSIMYDFYRRMPFNTNFDQYKHHVAGLNVAYINNFDQYHTMLDSPDNVCLASLQHHGNYALHLARHFGQMPLDDCYAPDAVFFNTLGSHMVVYPLSWQLPMTLATLGLFLAVLAAGLLTRRLSCTGLAGASLVPLLAVLVSSPLIAALSWGIFLRFREAALYQNHVYAFGFVLMGLAALAAVLGLVKHRFRPQNLLAGWLVWWAAGLTALQLYAPGGANTAMAPLGVGSAYLLALLWFRNGHQPGDSRLAWSVAAALPVLMFVAPLLVMAFYAITVLASAMLVPMVILLAGFVVPQLYLWSRSALFRAAGGLLAAGTVSLGLAYWGTLPGPTTPSLNTLAYAVDFDTGQAWWMSQDRQLDEWTSLYIPKGTEPEEIGRVLPHARRPVYKAPAPMPPFPPPVLEIREDRLEAGRRILECHLDSPRDAQRLWIEVISEAKIYSASILGHDLDGADAGWSAMFEILPREGATLRLETDPDAPLVFSVREMSTELPAIPGFVPRPVHMISEPNRTLIRNKPFHSEYTYSIASIDLGAAPAGPGDDVPAPPADAMTGA